MLGENRFWMKLHTLYIQFLVSNTHNFIQLTVFRLCPCGNLQTFRQAFFFDNQGMITGCLEGII